VTANWQVPRPGARVCQIDIEPSELGRHYPNAVSLLGDARTVLRQMLDGIAPAQASFGDWGGRALALREQWAAETEDLRTSNAIPMRPERLCADLGGLLPDDALVVSDTGHAGMWTGGWLDLERPGQGFIRAAGSLGWGLPAAIGAQMGAPDRQVVLFTGDGGLWYHVGEIETAVRWQTPLIMVVNNNRSLNQEIRPFVKAYGGQLHGAHADLWRFEDVDFVAMAEAMGASGRRVDKPGELPSALEEAVAATGPYLLDVRTDIDALAPLAHT
jgi:acetolactate synthase I/II/III large subunit